MRLIAAFLILLSCPADARVRSVRHPSPERILWIGAHPDDEALIAPILGPSCVEGRDVCSMLVMTHGERGDCALPGGCGDLSDLRSAEMQRAADLFRAHLTLWAFSDVMGDVVGTWSAEAGGRDALISRLQSLIAAERPTIIYTFDPNHGSSCHPAHRAIGALVIEASARVNPSPRIMFVETIIQGGFVFSSATPDASWKPGGWEYLIRDALIHASQFTPEQVEALRRTPAEQQGVWLATVPAPEYGCGT